MTPTQMSSDETVSKYCIPVYEESPKVKQSTIPSMTKRICRHATKGTHQVSAAQFQLYPEREIVRTVIVRKDDLVNTATTSSKRERGLKR